MRVSLPRYLKFSIWTAIILSVVMLILYVYLGTFMRMIADDYCSAYRGLEYGPIQGVILQYNTWAANYSNFFIKFGLAPLQPHLHLWMTFITIVVWLIAFYYLFYQLSTWIAFPNNVQTSAILVVLTTFYLYRLVPADQHIFWFAAIIPYVWVLIATTFLIGNFVHYFSAPRSQMMQIIMPIYLGIMILFLGGFVETQITMMVTIFALMLLAIPFVPRERRREYTILVVTCLIVALLALVIALFAPGPQIRRNIERDASHIPLSILLTEGVIYTFLYVFGEFFGITFGQTYALAYLSAMYCTLLFAGLILIQKYPDWHLPAPKKLALTALGVALISFILIASTVVPMYYAAVGLPLRALIHPRFIQLVTVIILAYLTLVAFQRYEILSKLEEQRTWPIVLIFISGMIVWSPIASIARYLSYLPNFQAYAQSWDSRQEILTNAEADTIVQVEPLRYDIEDHFVLEKAIDDAGFWINSCMASYYGLAGIEVLETADE